jgi:hypothetical protein
MNQSPLVSKIEVLLNIGSGFFLSIVVWQLLAHVLGIPMPISTNFLITSVFTVVSLLRSYFWRRFFARKLHMTIVNWVGK